MQLKIQILLLLITIGTQSAFIEKGDISNDMERFFFPDFISPLTNSQFFENINSYIFDLVQYNSNGDWAVIFYQDRDDAVYLNFFDIQGTKIAQYIFGLEFINFNEGDLGVSITSTFQNDEVFVAITRETEISKIDIVGAIIGIDGKFRRSEDWITLLTSEDYNFNQPSVLKCGNYIYVAAYTNLNSFSEFQGSGVDELDRRILESPPSEAKPKMGNPAFNYIDISGNFDLKPPTNLEGTRIEFFDAEQTSRVYMDHDAGLNIKHLGGTKASVVFYDKQNTELSISNNNQIVYFLIQDGQVQLPQVFDNTSTKYPNEKVFLQLLDIVNQGVIPGTQNIVLSYAADNTSLFISTINTEDNTTICHKSYSFEDTYFSDNFLDFNHQYHPTILIESENVAYISMDFQAKQASQFRFQVMQFNPNTCEIDTQIAPYEIVNNSIQSRNIQKMIFVKNLSLNQYRIVHMCFEPNQRSIQLSISRFQTMFNCDGRDETKNVCTSCQSGYALTFDGQCITPNCGMDCEQYDLICNMDSLQCLECINNQQCNDNEDSNKICHYNICQSNCYSNEDCSTQGKQCNLENNQCIEIIINENIQKIELPEPQTIPIIDANNVLTGNLEIEFNIEGDSDYLLEFLKLTINGKDSFPIKVVNSNKKIHITLPRNTENGQKKLKLFANKLTPLNSSVRRNLIDGYTTDQVYMEKTIMIIDTENQIEQIEKIKTTSQQKDEVINSQKKEISDDYTAYYVLVPIMIVGYILFAVMGFLLGKKQQISSQSKQQHIEDKKCKTDEL